MDTSLVIFGCIALAALTVLCIAGAVTLLYARKQLDRVIDTVEKAAGDMSDLKRQLEPVIQQSEVVLGQLHSTLENADSQLDKLGRGADTFASIADDVKVLETNLMAKVRGPLEDVASLVAGVARGASVFARKLVEK